MSNTSVIEQKHHSPMLIWSVMVLFFVYQFIARSAFPTVLTEEYMKYFCLDAQGVGTLVSCYYFVYTLLQIPVGIMIDRYSIKFLAPIATLVCASGVLIFISTQDVFIASIGQTLVGCGSAFAFLMVLKICIDLFPPERRAVMLTTATSIGCLGPVIFGPAVALIVKNFDWRAVMAVYVLAGYVLAAVMWNLIDDNTHPTQATAETEQSGKTSSSDQSSAKNAETANNMRIMHALKVVLSSPQAWILGVFALMQYSPLSALADLWGTSYIKKLYDADSAVSSLANNMIYLGMIIGGPLFSYFSVYIDSYKKTMIVSTIGCVLVFAVILFFGHYVPLYGMFVLLFVTGFFSSATLHFTLGAVLLPKEVGGILSGFINTWSMLSGVILMPLIGYLIDSSWNGTIENGIKVYSLADFQFGLTSVFVTLFLAVVFVLLMEDRSPKAED